METVLAIDMQDERQAELLMEAYRNCPRPTEQFFKIREAERRLDDRTQQLEQKLESARSLNPNMDIWELHSISLEVKNSVNELQNTLKEIGCLE